MNANLAGTLPDAWTDAWRSPARWPRSPAGYAFFRSGIRDAADVLEAGVATLPGRGRGFALRLTGEPEDTLAPRSYATSITTGLAAGSLSLGARIDAVYEDGEPASGWGLAGALGLAASGSELGTIELWGEYQRRRTDADGDGYAGEVVLGSPEPKAAEERLEPVIVLRGGRHTGDRFGIVARGPVSWYEASFALRRNWGSAGTFGLAIRRGEWRARSSCESSDTLCLQVADPTVGVHAVTAVDAALEVRFALALWLRAGGTWPLSGDADRYERPWPAELRTLGALRPGTARGLFFGVRLRPAARLALDAYGYPGFLSSRGASRRVGRYGVQLSVGW